MCGRGRFAVLAAHEVQQYTHIRNGAAYRSGKERQHGHQSGTVHGDIPVNSDVSLPAAVRINSDEHEFKLIDHFPVIENLSPGMECPVLVKSDTGYDVENMTWGIIPTYLDAPSANDHYRMFNKRVESLEASQVYPYFKTVLQTKRCVVILDGFYEWKEVAGKKHPYYVSLGNAEPMRMAGIYEDSIVFAPKICGLRPARTFSIITGESCAKFTAMHNRQPVLLTHEQALQWLDCAPDEVFKYIDALKMAHLDASVPMHRAIRYYPVSPKVTNPRYQESDCTQERSIGLQMTSFFKSSASSSGVKQEAAIKSEGINDSISGSSSSREGVTGEAGLQSGHGRESQHRANTGTGVGDANSGATGSNVAGQKRALPVSGLPSTTSEVNPSSSSGDTVRATKPGSERETAKLTHSPASNIAASKKAKLNSKGGNCTNGGAAGSTVVPKNTAAPSSPVPAKTKPITSFFSRSPKQN